MVLWNNHFVNLEYLKCHHSKRIFNLVVEVYLQNTKTKENIVWATYYELMQIILSYFSRISTTISFLIDSNNQEEIPLITNHQPVLNDDSLICQSSMSLEEVDLERVTTKKVNMF